MLIAAISPWRVGLPVCALEFAPMQISEPRVLLVSVWLTIMVLKAAKGHGVPASELRAVLA